jgi:hypothetical protein
MPPGNDHSGFSLIYSISLAARPVSDSLENWKGIIPHDFGALMPWQFAKAVLEEVSFLSGRDSQKREEKENTPLSTTSLATRYCCGGKDYSVCMDEDGIQFVGF